MTIRRSVSLVRFREMPIRKKLLIALILTSTVALLLAGVGVIISETVLNYQYLTYDLSTFVEVIGENTLGALAFDDPKTANETLATLQARPHVSQACLYLPDGTLFARYVRSGESLPCPSPEPGEELHSSFQGLLISHPIIQQSRRVGTLVLLYDLKEIYQRIALYGFIVLLLLALSSAVALLFSAKLRANIAAPILELESAANAVRLTKDYGIRAKRLSEDEVGRVVDRFNEMLASIQSRDKDLSTALTEREENLARLAQLNQKLESSNQELRRSNEDLERFAFVASHDLQEPMRTIASYSQLLVRDHAGHLDPQAGRFVNFIVEGIQRMRNLLSDVLEYSRIASMREKEGTSISLDAALGIALANLKSALEESGAHVMADPLPSLEGRESHLVPLFQNLIENSVKYHGSAPPRIHISVTEDHGELQFAVADNGIGIDPEYHQRIFVAFQRLHGKDIPGTGIGLAICQRIVERYGGRIWVESQGGHGTTFRFTLPNLGVRNQRLTVG